MSQFPSSGELKQSERHGPLMMVPHSGEVQPEGWLSRVMRILLGWKVVATRADLELVLAAHEPASGFSPAEAAMLRNILTLRECRIERIMVPRADILAVQKDITLADLVKAFESAGHSRLVVYNDTLDDPTGMVHIRDLIAHIAAQVPSDPAKPAGQQQLFPSDLNLASIDLATPLAAAKLVREILYAPPSMPALDLLAKMQAMRIQLALVIDEYGGTDGLVSMEDLVELIVGDIADEHDEQQTPSVTRQSDGSYLAAGRASLSDVRASIGDDFDVGEAGHEVDTLGGYLIIRAGHVPVRGELVPGPASFEAEVLDADPRRVNLVKIYRRGRRGAAVRESSALVKLPLSNPTQASDESILPPNPPPTL